MFAEWFTLNIDGAFITAIGGLVVLLGAWFKSHRKQENKAVTAVSAATDTVVTRFAELDSKMEQAAENVAHELARQRNDLLAHLGRNRQAVEARIDDLAVRFDKMAASIEAPKSVASDHPSGETPVTAGHRPHGVAVRSHRATGGHS